MGTIIGDLNSRRGRIEGMEAAGVGGLQMIKAFVPLSTMFGYETHMRSWTQGRANYTMRFKQYEEAPRGSDFDDDEPYSNVVIPKRPRPGGSSFGATLEDDEF